MSGGAAQPPVPLQFRAARFGARRRRRVGIRAGAPCSAGGSSRPLDTPGERPVHTGAERVEWPRPEASAGPQRPPRSGRSCRRASPKRSSVSVAAASSCDRNRHGLPSRGVGAKSRASWASRLPALAVAGRGRRGRGREDVRGRPADLAAARPTASSDGMPGCRARTRNPVTRSRTLRSRWRQPSGASARSGDRAGRQLQGRRRQAGGAGNASDAVGSGGASLRADPATGTVAAGVAASARAVASNAASVAAGASVPASVAAGASAAACTGSASAAVSTGASRSSATGCLVPQSVSEQLTLADGAADGTRSRRSERRQGRLLAHPDSRPEHGPARVRDGHRRRNAG
jgi:hypothetical protein